MSHSIQFNERNIAKLIVSYPVPRAIDMARVLTLLFLVLERLNGFRLDRFCSARTDDSNIMRSIAICFLPRAYDTCRVI